jgi:hypothetical protein
MLVVRQRGGGRQPSPPKPVPLPPRTPHPAGVDIIEAGFPVASPDDFAAVQAIALDVGNAVDADGYVPVICGLSRTREADLQTAWDAVRQARRPRVHTFIATSKIHMEHKLRMTEAQVRAHCVCSGGGSVFVVDALLPGLPVLPVGGQQQTASSLAAAAAAPVAAGNPSPEFRISPLPFPASSLGG